MKDSRSVAIALRRERVLRPRWRHWQGFVWRASQLPYGGNGSYDNTSLEFKFNVSFPVAIALRRERVLRPHRSPGGKLASFEWSQLPYGGNGSYDYPMFLISSVVNSSSQLPYGGNGSYDVAISVIKVCDKIASQLPYGGNGSYDTR